MAMRDERLIRQHDHDRIGVIAACANARSDAASLTFGVARIDYDTVGETAR